MPSATPVIDYEGSQYRTDFWTDQGREYEDRVERLVLGHLVPQAGRRIIEIGAGFGRLANLYTGYEQIILFDYSRTLLEDAVKEWGRDPRFLFVAGNVYELPFVTRSIDTVVMVRVMHHLANVPLALEQLRRVMHADSVAILEFANKRNLKSLYRWLFGKQSWSPFELEPYEFVELNFDFHPVWMQHRLKDAGFVVRQMLAVSHFRLPVMKRLFSPAILARVDQIISVPGGLYPLSPSVFVKTGGYPEGDSSVDSSLVDRDIAGLFCCPACKQEGLTLVDENALCCGQCGVKYGRQGRIWDFKERL